MDIIKNESAVIILNNSAVSNNDTKSSLETVNELQEFSQDKQEKEEEILTKKDIPNFALKCEEGQRLLNIPYILNGQLYKIITRRGENVTVKCCNCPAERVYRGSVRSTGNFHMHIKRRHPDLMSKLHDMKVNALLERRDRLMKQRLRRSPTLFQSTFKRKTINKMERQEINSPVTIQSNVPIDQAAENGLNLVNNQFSKVEAINTTTSSVTVEKPTTTRYSVDEPTDNENSAEQPDQSSEVNYSNFIATENFSQSSTCNPIDLSTGHSKLRDALLGNAQNKHKNSSGFYSLNKSASNDNSLVSLAGVLSNMNDSLDKVQRAMNVRNQLEANRIVYDIAKFKYLHPNFVFDL